MPYSMDSEENRNNPSSPSYMNMTEQLLYKMAALDASMNSGFRRLDEKMDRFQTDLHDSQISTNDRINDLDREFNEVILRKRQRIDELERRLGLVETWRSVFTAQIAIAFIAITIVWTVFAPAIRHIFGIPA